MKLYTPALLLLATACLPVEEKDTAAEDTATEENETEEETGPDDTGDEEEEEEVRLPPESGCEQEGWLIYNGAEYYYFMYAYDEADLVTFSELNDMSTNLDNVVDEMHWYAYDDEGLLATQEDDVEGDGVADLAYEWAHENGFTTEFRMDNENDGLFDDEWLTTRDGSGYVIERTLDEAMDGTVDTRWTTEWNEDMTHVVMYEDEGDDGEIEIIYEADLDSEKRATYQSMDEDADGVLEQAETWEYNDDGNLYIYQLDDDGDGAWDFVRTYTWTNADQWEMIEDTYYDETGGVESNYIYTMTYDADGHSDEMTVGGSADYSVDHMWYCAE
jgi:hypothetical protein